MRLAVVFSDRPNCYVGLHAADANVIFGSAGAPRHFCRPLRLDCGEDDAGGRDGRKGVRRIYVGWLGTPALAQGRMEVAGPFAACLGLKEGDIVTASAVTETVKAASVMVQPNSVDDWEVVELQASFIEEHLLEQVAVLSPGMIFSIWIHGRMPVRLRVDPKDSNRADCFLLDQDSELVIESKRRAAESSEPARPLFGRPTSGPDQEVRLRIRVLVAETGKTAETAGTAPSDSPDSPDSPAVPAPPGFHALDAPLGQLHPMDLERLAGGCAAPGRCLAWLQPRQSSSASGASNGPTPGTDRLPGGRSSSTGTAWGPRLLQLEAHEGVPRAHLRMGHCQALHGGLPCFSLASLWRCRQVPVFIPQIELVPLCPPYWNQEDSRAVEDVSSSLLRLFRAFVGHCGEVDLMDGAVLLLRGEAQTARGTLDSEEQELAAKVPEGTESSDTTDLYEGLSDIDDIYQHDCSGLVSSSLGGIHELDLGLDEAFEAVGPPWQAQAPEVEREPGAKTGRAAWKPPQQPETIPVRVRFVLRAAREDLQHARTPPFLHLTPSVLASDITVSVALPEPGAQNREGTEPVGEATAAVSACDPLELLWSRVRGICSPEEEGRREVVRLITQEESSTPLDSLELFREPASRLRRHLLAQLGCLVPEAGAAQVDEPDPLRPSLPSSLVPGATAVMGTTGAGKSLLCRQVLAELRARGVMPVEVACTKLGQPGRKFKAVQEWLYAIFQFACWYSPAVVLLDDLGALCPDVEAGAVSLSITEERSAFLAELLLDLLPEVRASAARVAVVATLPDQSAVHRSLWAHPALEHKVSLRPPHLKERPQILRLLCAQQRHLGFAVDDGLCSEGALDDWGGNVDGFSVADLSRLVGRGCIEASAEASDLLMQGSSASRASQAGRTSFSLQHLQRACKDFVPAMLADQSFFTSDVSLTDVGGMEEAKQALLDMLTMPTRYAVLLDRAPVRGHRGLMLVGPPGCGKTMLVHAAANETKGLLRFLAVKGPELLSKYIGASEAGVRQVFERAAAAAPSVIFFDEIEALAPRRGGDSTGVTDRVVNQMLCYLDGVEDRGRVFVVAATGRPDLVDPALMRPGRFDKVNYCGLPSETEKLEVCEILAKKHGVVAAQTAGGGDLRHELQALVSRIPRLFTCADLNALFSSAKIAVVNEAIRADAPSGASTKRSPPVTTAHLFTALATAKASVSEADEQRYAQVFAGHRPRETQQPSRMKVALA